MTDNQEQFFLYLVRLGIGTGNVKNSRISLKDQIKWQALKALADSQGLSAVVLDGLEKLPDDVKPEKELLLNWIGEVLQSYEQRYRSYEKSIGSLADFYNKHGYKMMVLKGYACGLTWHKPEHRPCGDIDIWLFGHWRDADMTLSKTIGKAIDGKHHHHTVFEWDGFSVENHYDFINVHRYGSNKNFEILLKHFGQDDSYVIDVNGNHVYIPSPNLHALFLLRHSMMDFVASNITLKQVLDWAFWAQKNTKEIDWEILQSILGEYHMMDYFNLLNAICVEDLGFETNTFPEIKYNYELKERFLCDVLSPAFLKEEPKGKLLQLLYKYKRWHGNAWKQSLCFKDSRWSNFWHGVLGHLINPRNNL